MAEFSELIKNFDNIRDYMRDFYVYGFKSREDFTQKSTRTYDNERRRIESYLGRYINWGNTRSGKRVFISIDSSKISQNPLYAAWKSKSFTSNDIILHFYILDILKEEKDKATASCDEEQRSGIGIKQLTDFICERSGLCVDPQTVRIKVNEYVAEGIINAVKYKKAMLYSLSDKHFSNLCCRMQEKAALGDMIDKSIKGCEELVDAVCFFQEAAPFGVVGSYILDNEQRQNDIFSFKHHFIVHTLEDKIVFELIRAIRKKSRICFLNQSSKMDRSMKIYGIPLKIFVSGQSGRRFATLYNERTQRFSNYRLDYMKSVEILYECNEFDSLKAKLDQNLDKCWGVSFGGEFRGACFSMTLQINEQTEMYIVGRLEREGRNGVVERIDDNVFRFSIEIFDTNEIMSWVKSFIGRIIKIECENEYIMNQFYLDMKRMNEMYLEIGK